jgi:hypothetical protein
LALYIERVQKSKDKPVVLTEEKLFELLKKDDSEEIVRILTEESAVLSAGNEKGTIGLMLSMSYTARFRACLQPSHKSHSYEQFA